MQIAVFYDYVTLSQNRCAFLDSSAPMFSMYEFFMTSDEWFKAFRILLGFFVCNLISLPRLLASAMDPWRAIGRLCW